ncbi:MAG: hypothetical protein GY944_17070 [bacterium]|nr:hypothetical protein [bacterium]
MIPLAARVLLSFVLLGNPVFMNDVVAASAHNAGQLRNWTGQPLFDVAKQEIVNASNNDTMRPADQQVRWRPSEPSPAACALKPQAGYDPGSRRRQTAQAR